MTIPSNPTVIKTIFRLVFMESKRYWEINRLLVSMQKR